MDPNRCLHSDVQCSIIHNSQDVETTKCPLTDEWIKKTYVHATRKWHFVFSLKKEILDRAKEVVRGGTDQGSPDLRLLPGLSGVPLTDRRSPAATSPVLPFRGCCFLFFAIVLLFFVATLFFSFLRFPCFHGLRYPSSQVRDQA